MPFRTEKYTEIHGFLISTALSRGFHFMRSLMAHVGKSQRTMVAALPRTAFSQDSRSECHQQWRLVADQLREKYPKIAALMDGCEKS